MLNWLPHPIKGSLSFLLYVVNTLFWFVPIMLLAILKLLPIQRWQAWMTYLLDAMAVAWISVNNLTTRLFTSIKWRVEGLDKLSRKDWYLIIANHQSWADILILQNIFNRKIPFIKFFLKKELLYVPFMGLAWWALDFPFMKRFSKEYLAKYPEKRGQDLATTRKACARYKTNPVSVFNFLEGTRLSPQKHAQQQSPFRHLLKPKAGGIAFVLDAMGEQLHSIVNVTIHYPQGNPGFWDLLCGRVARVEVTFEALAIPKEFLGRSYDQDEAYRLAFQQWINRLWEEKDERLERMRQQ